MRHIIRLVLMIIALSIISGGVIAQELPPGTLAVFVFQEGETTGIKWVNPATGESNYRVYPDFDRVFTSLPAVGCYLPIYQPFGHLRFMDVRTQAIRFDIPVDTYLFMDYPLYSPDGHYRWMLSVSRNPFGDWQLQRLILNMDAGTLVERVSQQHAFQAVWSPDSRHLVEYSTTDPNSYDTSLATDLVNPDTGATIALPVAVMRGDKVWSPDSTRLLLRNTQEEIEVIDLNGQTQHRLAGFNDVDSMRWLDAQTVLLVARNRGGDDDKTTPLRILAWSLVDDSVRDYGPPVKPNLFLFISPDSRFIYVHDAIVNLQTGEHIREMPLDSKIRQVIWSPDARYLIIGTSGSYGLLNIATGDATAFALDMSFTLARLDDSFVYFENMVDNQNLGILRFTDAGAVQQKIVEPGASGGILCLPEGDA